MFNYFDNFRKKEESSKAFIIADQGNCEDVLLAIKAVCCETNFNPIIIDELEPNKKEKLRSLFEATQTDRLATIRDSLKFQIESYSWLKDKEGKGSSNLNKIVKLISAQTRTCLVVVDNFSSEEEGYLSLLKSTILKARAPIVILTSYTVIR